jgi:hypothetical protein
MEPVENSTTPKDVWDQVHRKLVKLKLRVFLKDLHERIAADAAYKSLQDLSNRVGVIPGAEQSIYPVFEKYLESMLLHIDQSARGTYDIYYDVWDKQGNKRSPEFLRAVFEKAVLPRIRRQESRVIAIIRQIAKPTNYPRVMLEAQINQFKERIKGLKQDWRDRIEIETTECDLAQVRPVEPSSKVEHTHTLGQDSGRISVQNLPHSNASNVELRSAHPPSPTSQSEGEHFLWKGEIWEVSYQHKTAILKDSKGMRFLAVLLRDPRKPFEARELYQFVTRGSEEPLELESGDRPLDDKAKAEALSEYNRLKIKKDEAIATGDLDRAAAIEEEMDGLANHLAEQRDMYSPQTERARKNIGNQLESVTSRIANALPDLAAHLRKSLRKGRFVSYQADLQWVVLLPSDSKNRRS